MSWVDKLEAVPHKPGVYIFKNSEGKVIYVGKAKDLKKRLSSYKMGKDERVLLPFILADLKDFEFIVTENEVEAFLLEDTLIKKHKPSYNIRLRDDKTYVSIEITKGDEFPGVFIIRRKPRKRSSLVFGPYSSASSVRETLRYVLRVFPVRTCTDTKMRMHHDRPCIYYQIKRCSAPCTGYVTEEKYREYVEGLIKFFQGEGDFILEDLREKMNKLASEMKFEEAAEYRDRIRALERVLTRQAVVTNQRYDADYLGWAYGGGNLVISRIVVRNGRVVDREISEHSPVINPDDEVASFIYQLYRMVTNPPPVIYIPRMENAEVLKELLFQLDVPVKIRVGGQGFNRDLLQLARENADTHLQVVLRRGEMWKALDKVQKRFRLARFPRRIECVDISHLGGKESVGSMVTFIDGKPAKDEYRRYRIKTLEGIDDFGMIREVLTRRLGEDREKPDLILIDGGKGQLSAAERVLKELGLEDEIDLLAIAKDRGSGKGERIFKPERVNPVKLKKSTPEFKLLTSIRDEAHRFAISYNRQLRSKEIKSSLTRIPGIGKKRAKLLWENFDSMEEMAAAPEKLAEVLKIPLEKARKIAEELQQLLTTASQELTNQGEN